MELQPIPLETLRQHLKDPLGIFLARESHHEVISKAHQTGAAPHPRFDRPLKPNVQHVVQVDVRKRR